MRKAMLVVLIVLVLAGTVAPAYAQGPEPSARGGRGGPIVDAFRKIGVMVIDIGIGIATVLMAVGIMTGFVGGQFLVTVGQPYGLSSAWVKVISVIMLGIGAFLTITIVNTIINAVAELIPPTQIPSL